MQRDKNALGHDLLDKMQSLQIKKKRRIANEEELKQLEDEIDQIEGIHIPGIMREYERYKGVG